MNTLTIQQLRRRIEGMNIPQNVVAASMPVIQVIAVGGVREGFRLQISPDGTPFRRLSRPRPDNSDIPLQDQGLLQASVGARTIGQTLQLFASHPGAAIHQYGGDILPRRGKFLTIPQTREAKRIGSPGRGRFPRPLFAWTSKLGSRFLAERTERGLVIQYQLVERVHIHKRPYLGYSERTLVRIDRVLTDNWSATVNRALS